MSKAEMELIWNGPMQNALRIVAWRGYLISDLRHDGVLPILKSKTAAKKKRAA